MLNFLNVNWLLLFSQTFSCKIWNPTTSELSKTLGKELVFRRFQYSANSFWLDLSSFMRNEPTRIAMLKLFFFIDISLDPFLFCFNIELKVVWEFFVKDFFILFAFREIKFDICDFNVLPKRNVASHLQNFDLFVEYVADHFFESWQHFWDRIKTGKSHYFDVGAGEKHGQNLTFAWKENRWKDVNLLKVFH